MNRRLAPLALLLALTACGHSPETQFLTLDPVPGPASAGPRGGPVRLPSIQVPPEFDRVEFAHQTGPGQMKVEDLVHWSAPLGMLARNTLILDLAQRLPRGAVLPPDAAAQPNSIRATVAILSFAASGSDATMTATYAFGPEEGSTARPRWAELRTPVGQTPVETARAFSALLGQLADRMAADLPP
jgi:uncharacterized lipoprotein YmbA